MKLPEETLRDEAEMRAFYLSVGMSPCTTEAAIKARRDKPIEPKVPSPLKGKPRNKQRG
jgi:hypothetical protein